MPIKTQIIIMGTKRIIIYLEFYTNTLETRWLSPLLTMNLCFLLLRVWGVRKKRYEIKNKSWQIRILSTSYAKDDNNAWQGKKCMSELHGPSRFFLKA